MQELETLQLSYQCMCLNKKKYLDNFILWNIRKLDNMHHFFNKFHSSDVFVIFLLSSFRHSKLLINILALENKHTWIYILRIAINVNAFIRSSGFTSHFTAISAKNSITAGWPRIALIIPQLEFWIFQVVMFSKKTLFAIVNISCKSSAINHKCWICLLIFTFMSTSEASYSK